jgi:phage terminase large subunit-like protein
VCAFIEKLPHVKGRWSTPTIVLEPWQCFLLTTIFGWVNENGLRRFRKALVVTPRKNSKTTLAAGVGLYLLTMDEEPGAEVYSAATTRDQARICWDMARLMVQRTPRLRDRYGIEPLAHSIAIEHEGAFFKPLSRDADSLEGLNPHGAIIDELHAHKTREVFDVLDDATGSRRQPLLFVISTEGDSGEGIFPEQLDYAKAVLDGRHEDDNYFALIYTIDQEDDWTQPESWRKANPNVGVSVFEEDLEIRCRQAIANADSQASFLTKRLNVRVGAGSAYFNMLAWSTLCCDPALRIEDFRGQQCIVTLDLASKRDLTAKMIVFHRGADYYVFGKYYLPSDALEPGKANYDFYRGWAHQGWLTLTDGNITDYDFLERDLLEDVAAFKPKQVGVDPNYNAGQFTTRMLAEGVPMIDVAQNVQNFSEPMKQLDALTIAGRIHHNGDPVLAWAIGNVVAKRDAKENVYPRKARADNKIDPAVALIANLSLQLRLKAEPEWDFRVIAI